MNTRRPPNKEANRLSSYHTRIVGLFTGRLFWLLLLVLAGIFLRSGWRAWQSYVQVRAIGATLRQTVGEERAIMHRDEALTMSAMMAAATCEAKWITRYEEFGTRTDLTVKEIVNMYEDDALNAGAVLATLANTKLGKMESEALELVRKGNGEAALALLQSPEYEEQKQIYQKGMTELISNVYSVSESQRDRHVGEIEQSLAEMSIILLVMIFVWLAAHRLRRRRRERIQTEQKLRAFAQEWQETFNAITDAVCIIDKAEGKILQCNRGMTSLLKKPYSEIIGRSCCELIHGSAEPVRRCPLARMWNTRRSEATVLQMGERWFQVKADPVINNDRHLVGAVHVMSDITEHKKAEKALQESEKKFRLAFANAQDGILWTDIETGTIVNCNRAAEELFGKRRGEIIGQHYRTLGFEGKSEHFHDLIKELCADQKNSIEATIPAKSGETKTVTISVSTMVVEGKEIVQGIIRDVTESKRAMEEVENLAKFPSEDPNPVLRISEDCRILYANDASAPVLETWRVHEGGCLGEPWCKKMQDVCNSGGSCAFELNCDDGHIFFITLQPIVGSGYVNVYGLDITKRKKAEKEKIDLELQLSQKQKMEAIGTLAGGIAHDFSNILAAMQGYVELSLEDLPDGAAVRENLEHVLSCGNRAAKLVRQVLTFSRKGQEDQQEKELVQIGSVVKEVLRMLRSSLPATIRICRKIEADSSIVVADPTQIHQVLVNLCTNASHAMRETGGLLEVSLTDVTFESERQIGDECLSAGSYVKVSVSDTGCGMDKEIIDRIFEPFFTTKTVNEGTGLGLSVVHGIIKSHQGAITVSSTPGQGTTFEIFLPKVESDEVPEGEPAEQTIRDKEVILLVDDEEMMVDVTKQILERLGYTVIAMTSSIVALEAFQEKPDEFDVVITDQIMPNLTGTQLAQELINIRSDIPVILCCGFGENVNPEEAKSIGVRELITKPISKHEIGVIIRKVLDREEIRGCLKENSYGNGDSII